MESREPQWSEGRQIAFAKAERRRVGLDSSDEAIQAARQHPERTSKPRWLVSSWLTPAEVSILAEKRATREAKKQIPFARVVPSDVWAGSVFDYQPEHGAWVLQFTRDSDHWLEVARDTAGFPYPLRLSAKTVTHSLDALERAEERVRTHLAAHPELGDVGVSLSIERNCVYVNVDHGDPHPAWFSELGSELIGRLPGRAYRT